MKYGKAGETVTNAVFVSGLNNTTNQIVNLDPGSEYWFFVTATNQFLESDKSTVLTYNTPAKPSVVKGLQLEFNLLSSVNSQGPFTNEVEFRVTYEIPQKFYLAEVSKMTLTNILIEPPLP